MEEIKVGMRFQNRANKRIGYVARIDKTGTDIMFEEVAEGQSKGARASLADLKGQKSWKYLHDDKVIAEETAGDGTPYSQVLSEIKQDEENLAEKYAKPKKEKTPKEKPVKEKKVAEKPKKEKPVKQEKPVKKEEKPKQVKEKPVVQPDENAIVSKFKTNIDKEGIAEDLADVVESIKGMSAVMSDDGCGLSIVRDRGIIAKVYVKTGKITIDCANRDMVEKIIKSI